MLPFARMLEYGNIRPEPADRIRMFSVGYSHLVLVDNETNILYTQGRGAEYQLGTGNNLTSDGWVQTLTGVRYAWACEYGSLALKLDGTWWYCGEVAAIGSGNINVYNQTWTDISTKFSAFSIYDFSTLELDKIKVSGSRYGTHFVIDGVMYGFGLNSFGFLGQGNGTAISNVTKLSNLVVDDFVRSTLDGTSYFISAGVVYGAGRNSYGTLGLGNTTQTLTYTAIPNSTGAISIGCGDMSLKVYKSLELWQSGNNSNGQLGNGATDGVNLTTLTKTADLSSYTDIYNSTHYTYRSLVSIIDGVYWYSGYNINGRLGNGNSTQVTTLTQMQLAPDIINVTGIFQINGNTYITVKDKIYASGARSGIPDASGSVLNFSLVPLPF